MRKSADRSTHSFYFYLININFSFGVFFKCVLETKPCSAALALRFRELTGWLAEVNKRFNVVDGGRMARTSNGESTNFAAMMKL